MEVLAFVGPSGTGKSHRALVVAHDNDVECIIDDGILIYRNRIVAGFSAKKEANRLKAVRRAIFQDRVQVASVKEQLECIKPERLLILGTSEKMVKQITRALQVPAPSRYIHIEDVASEREIEKAQYARLKEGKHIIPVPTMELKPHFKGYLIDPINPFKSFFKRKKSSTETNFEKSVVRPVFSYYGRLTFSDQVLIDLINNSLKKVPGLAQATSVKIKKKTKESNGLLLDMTVNIVRGFSVKPVMQAVQRAVQNEIEYSTGMSLDRLEIEIGAVVDNS